MARVASQTCRLCDPRGHGPETHPDPRLASLIYFVHLLNLKFNTTYHVVGTSHQVGRVLEKPNLPSVLSVCPSFCHQPPGPHGRAARRNSPERCQPCFLRVGGKVPTISYRRCGPTSSSLTFTAGRLGLPGILG